jgi:hypothetical protein
LAFSVKTITSVIYIPFSFANGVTTVDLCIIDRMTVDSLAKNDAGPKNRQLDRGAPQNGSD